MEIMNDLEWSMLVYYVIYLKISEKSCNKTEKEALACKFWHEKGSLIGQSSWSMAVALNKAITDITL